MARRTGGPFCRRNDVKRDDFVFAIGYHGSAAIVDGQARREHRGKPAMELLETGLYRAAFCAAVYDDELDTFLPAFRDATGIPVNEPIELQRLFGVFSVPDDVSEVTVIK